MQQTMVAKVISELKLISRLRFFQKLAHTYLSQESASVLLGMLVTHCASVGLHAALKDYTYKVKITNP